MLMRSLGVLVLRHERPEQTSRETAERLRSEPPTLFASTLQGLRPGLQEAAPRRLRKNYRRIVLRLSARVRSTAAAQQASGLVTLPLIGIAYAQATGSLFGASSLGWVIGALAWMIALASLSRGMAKVKRSRLLGVADGI